MSRNVGFLWSVFSRVWTESDTILSIYRKILIRGSLHFGILHAMSNIVTQEWGGGKKFAFKLPKLPDLAKCVKKCQKLFYYFGNLKSEGLKICMEFAYCFRQTLGKSDSKKTIKNRYQTFYWSSFPTPQQFLLFWLCYQYTHFSSFLGRSIQ